MTEQEWLSSKDPTAMLLWCLRNVKKPRPEDERKLRLFACEWYARVFPPDHEVHPVIEAVRGWADGKLTREEAIGSPGMGYGSREQWYLFRELPDCLRGIGELRLHPPHTKENIAAILRDIIGNPFRPSVVLRRDLGTVLENGPEKYQQRDVILADCLTPTVLSLAQAAYDERQPDGTLDPARLAVLSDALEEAGCPSEECSKCDKGWIPKAGVPDAGMMSRCPDCKGTGRVLHHLLAHLRSPGPHYRGCWAIDLIRGNS